MPLSLTTPVEQQRRPVSEGSTRPLAWRLEQLGRLELALQERSDAVLEALATDLGKPGVEAFYELVAVQQELRLCRRRVQRWMAPRDLEPPSQRPDPPP